MRLVIQLFLWLVFTVLMGLGALVARAIIISVHGGTFDFAALTGEGDLFIIAAVLSAESLRHIFSSCYRQGIPSGAKKVFLFMTIAACFVLVLSASLYFAVSSEYLRNHGALLPLVAATSISVFNFSVLNGSLAIICSD